MPTITGSNLHLKVKDVSPTTELKIPGEGMPISDSPSSRGDLIVRFHILWPNDLSDQQKEQLNSISFDY